MQYADILSRLIALGLHFMIYFDVFNGVKTDAVFNIDMIYEVKSCAKEKTARRWI